MPLTPKAMEAAVIKNMPAKTGKSLEEWVALAKAQAPTDKKGRMEWLKTTCQLGQVQASIILSVLETGKSNYADVNSLMENLFAGENADVRPLYELVKKRALANGKDIKVYASRTYLTFSRNKEFLTVKPTKGVLIIGLALPEDIENDRLSRARFLGTPHRINLQLTIREDSDVDRDFQRLIKQAYEES